MSFILSKEQPGNNIEFQFLCMYGTFRSSGEIYMRINLHEAMYVFAHWRHPRTFAQKEEVELIHIKCEVVEKKIGDAFIAEKKNQ